MGLRLNAVVTFVILASGITEAQPHARANKISGRLVDQTGAPIPNGNIVVRLVGSSDQELRTQTDRVGAFECRGIMPDTYDVVFQTRGFKSVTLRVNRTEADNDVGTVVLEIGPILDPITVEGPPRVYRMRP